MFQLKPRSINDLLISVTDTATLLFSLVDTASSSQNSQSYYGNERDPGQGVANCVSIRPQDGDIRVVIDATPTATKGFLIRSGTRQFFNGEISKMMLIRTGAANVAVDIAFWKAEREEIAFANSDAVGGNVASGSADSGNPVKVGGVYNSTLPTLTTGQRGDLQLTSNGSVLSRSDAYDTASQSDRGNEVAPLNQQFVNETLINTTNVAAATNYYPSTAGVAMDGYKTLSIQGVTSGGVTTTVEATNDDAASPAWVDVTLAFNNLMTGATSAATQVDTSFLLSPTLGNVLNVKALRIKSVTSDATNAVLYAIRRVSL